MNTGQMLYDVRLAAGGEGEVFFTGGYPGGGVIPTLQIYCLKLKKYTKAGGEKLIPITEKKSIWQTFLFTAEPVSLLSGCHHGVIHRLIAEAIDFTTSLPNHRCDRVAAASSL